jgi:hypothetical protein
MAATDDHFDSSDADASSGMVATVVGAGKRRVCEKEAAQ